ncbi:DUF1381 domain-containing protein, partial [Staphylococcus pseudintermedius]|nr:DUF1381 domain-containing protein [Staphylococcus pseudintermedius]EGQ4318486.1 DUF1381 domain-containing protein [Staphylococcus pseudintermedius]
EIYTNDKGWQDFIKTLKEETEWD